MMQGQVFLTLSWRRPLPYRNQSIDLLCSTNQWTGFYMITASVVKELKQILLWLFRNNCSEVFCEKAAPKNSPKIRGKHQTLAQVFFHEFYKIYKDTHFTGNLRTGCENVFLIFLIFYPPRKCNCYQETECLLLLLFSATHILSIRSQSTYSEKILIQIFFVALSSSSKCHFMKHFRVV